MDHLQSIINQLSNDDLDKAYAENQTNRRNHMTSVIDKAASMELEMLYDKEISKRTQVRKYHFLLRSLPESVSRFDLMKGYEG